MDELSGGASDKAEKLAKAIEALAPASWRVSCRSVAWHSEINSHAIEAILPEGRELVIARLEPLDQDEAADLLKAYGEADPERFLQDVRLAQAS